MDCHFLLQGNFPIQESNLGLPHCRQTLYCLSHQEKGKATPSSVLAWRIPWNPWGRKESDMTEQLSLSLHFFLKATPLLFQFRMFLMLTLVFRGRYAFSPFLSILLYDCESTYKEKWVKYKREAQQIIRVWKTMSKSPGHRTLSITPETSCPFQITTLSSFLPPKVNHCLDLMGITSFLIFAVM